MTQFRNYDAPQVPQVPQVRFELVTEVDEYAPPPWESDEGFWPSRDPDAPGYVPPDKFAEEELKAHARKDMFLSGDWCMVGVIARAVVSVPIGGGSFAHYTLDSPGLWGVEGDCGEDYMQEVFEEEKRALLSAMADIGRAASELLPAY